MSTRSFTSKSKLKCEDGTLYIPLDSKLVERLGWKEDDEVVTSLDTNGMLLARNLSTKAADVNKTRRENLQEQVEELLPKGFKLISMTPLSIRPGFGLNLYKPPNFKSDDYWSFTSALVALGRKHNLQLEVLE